MTLLPRPAAIALLAGALLLGACWPPAPCAAALPGDVPGDHWAAPAITTLTDPELDLVDLFPDDTFRGPTTLTRYDLAQSLDSMARYLAGKGVRLGRRGALPPVPYTDVPADHFAVPAIRRLLWMIPGEKTLFRGAEPMTRLDMAFWLYRLLRDLPQGDAVKLAPAPPDLEGSAVAPARWTLAAGKEGLISRYPDGRFHPERHLTRYEMAYTMFQVLQWLAPTQTETPPTAADNTPPEVRVYEPEVEGSRDFLVVARKKQVAVSGLAADDTGIARVAVNETDATLAFADEADLRKAGLKGPAASWFRVQVPAPAEGQGLTIEVTDKAGKTTRRRYNLKPPAPDSAQVVQAAAQPAGAERVARKWALLVGVNAYEDDNIPALRYSVRDITAVHDLLTDPRRGGFDKDTVFLLTDDTPDKPTNINVTKYLNRIARRAEPGDMVLVYFSGHGYEADGKGYILPRNTDVKALATSAIDNSDFTDTLDRMKAQRIIALLDSCHSGAVRREGGAALSNQYYTAYGGGKGRLVLASCSPGQQSWEDSTLGQGVFTEFVKRALAGQGDENRDGAVTFMELAIFVHDNVEKWATERGKKQEPMVQAENYVMSMKDIVLSLNPDAVPTGPLAQKKRVVYSQLGPEDADYACALLEKAAPTDLERKILQYLEQMIAEKITPQRYLDFVRTMAGGR